MTLRKFNTMCKDHKGDIKYNKRNAALFRLNKKWTINIFFNEIRLIYKSNFSLGCFIRKSNEIYLRG